MTNRRRVSGVVINIKVFTMRVNLINFLFHIDFFIEIARLLSPSLSILMLPLKFLIPKANVSECKQFFLLLFFFVFDNLFFHSLIFSEVFFFYCFWIFLEINFSQRVLQTDRRPRNTLFNLRYPTCINKMQNQSLQFCHVISIRWIVVFCNKS